MAEIDNPEDTTLLIIGYVRKPHGLNGEVVVRLTTNRTERLDPGSELFAADERIIVATSRPKDVDFLIRFEGISGREAAERLKGVELRAAPIDDPDELWVHELIGLRVVDQHGVDHGEVVELLVNPASDLLALENGSLVPVRFIESTTDDEILVDTPPGLFEVNDGSGTEGDDE